MLLNSIIQNPITALHKWSAILSTTKSYRNVSIGRMGLEPNGGLGALNGVVPRSTPNHFEIPSLWTHFKLPLFGSFRITPESDPVIIFLIPIGNPLHRIP